MVFVVAVLLLLAWGALLLSKAVTATVAEVWFAAKERHTKRIIQLSKEDT
jgi:hypothetical protein